MLCHRIFFFAFCVSSLVHMLNDSMLIKSILILLRTFAVTMIITNLADSVMVFH